MNTLMWDSPFTRQHLACLAQLGAVVVPPVSKTLACGDVGVGAMAAPQAIADVARAALALAAPSPPSTSSPPASLPLPPGESGAGADAARQQSAWAALSALPAAARPPLPHGAWWGGLAPASGALFNGEGHRDGHAGASMARRRRRWWRGGAERPAWAAGTRLALAGLQALLTVGGGACVAYSLARLPSAHPHHDNQRAQHAQHGPATHGGGGVGRAAAAAGAGGGAGGGGGLVGAWQAQLHHPHPLHAAVAAALASGLCTAGALVLLDWF